MHNPKFLRTDYAEESVTPIFDKQYKRSLYNISPRKFQDLIDEIVPLEKRLFGMDEDSLLKEMAQAGKSPHITDGRLRTKFWIEYDTAQVENKDIRIAAVVGRVCSQEYFYGTYAKDPYRLAYLLCIPTDYETQLDETLHFSMREVREILAMPNMIETDGGPLPNMKLLELKTKIHFMVESRKMGSVIQRAEQKSLNMNYTGGIAAGDVANAIEGQSMKEIEERLKELENRDRSKPTILIEQSNETEDV